MKKKLTILISCIMCMMLLTACDGIKVIENYFNNLGISFGAKSDAGDIYDITIAPTPAENPYTEPGADDIEQDYNDNGPEENAPKVRTTADEIPYNDPIKIISDNYESDKKKADKKNPEVGKIYFIGNLIMDKVQFDLDCNGKTNTITTDFNEYGGAEFIKVSKSAVDIFLAFLEPNAYAISLDGKTYCLMLYDYGMSDDYSTHFFSFDGDNLHYVGSMPFFASSVEVKNNDPSTLKFWGSRRFDLVQTEFCMTAYSPVIGSDGYVESIEQVEQKYYNYDYSITGEYGYGYADRYYPLTLTCDLQVYSRPDYSAETYILHPGNIQFTYTDAKDWIFIECQDGSNGWMSATEYLSLYGYTEEGIYGLSYAD